MTFDQSPEAELVKPLPRPPDTLYNIFEDTVAILEELIFAFDPDMSTSLVSSLSQKFFEDILDQLIRWGMQIYGRSGSLRTLTGTVIGNHIEMILWSMEDELQLIQLKAKKVQKTRLVIYQLLLADLR
jgi:hypothetical protein